MGLFFYGPVSFVIFLLVSAFIIATLFTMGIKLMFLILGIFMWGILILIFPALFTVFLFLFFPLIIFIKILF